MTTDWTRVRYRSLSRILASASCTRAASTGPVRPDGVGPVGPGVGVAEGAGGAASTAVDDGPVDPLQPASATSTRNTSGTVRDARLRDAKGDCQFVMKYHKSDETPLASPESAR